MLQNRGIVTIEFAALMPWFFLILVSIFALLRLGISAEFLQWHRHQEARTLAVHPHASKTNSKIVPLFSNEKLWQATPHQQEKDRWGFPQADNWVHL